VKEYLKEDTYPKEKILGKMTPLIIEVFEKMEKIILRKDTWLKRNT
jgi:hypothetical protein